MLRVLYKDVTGCSVGLDKDAIAMFSSFRWIARQRNLEWWRRRRFWLRQRGLRSVLNTASKWEAVIWSDRFQYLEKDHCRTQSRVLRENDASVRERMISQAKVEASRITATFLFRLPDWIIDDSFDRMFSNHSCGRWCAEPKEALTSKEQIFARTWSNGRRFVDNKPFASA